MATDRRFAQFKKTNSHPRLSEIPKGGFCLSTFLVISKPSNPYEVLMGRMNPNAQWDHIGALDPERVERHSKGWMLPSSGLIFGEAPQDAAKRILAEQLNLLDQRLDGPVVFSEVYGQPDHWDVEFIFLGEREAAPRHEAWRDLKFVDLTKTKKEEIARMHEDVLAHVGKWPTS